MKLFSIFFLLMLQSALAQNVMELTPAGFAPVEIPRPQKPNDRVQDQIRAWLADYNRSNEFGYDVYDVSATAMKIDSYKENAFYYMNKGETFQHRIKYTIALDIGENNITYKFSVKEIYAAKVLTDLTVAKFFNSDGKLKSDYPEVKKSLEKTANDMAKSFANYMALLR